MRPLGLKVKRFVYVVDWLDLTSPIGEPYHNGAPSANLIPKGDLFAVRRPHRLLTEV